MTIQALAWAMEQTLPGEARCVLFALANHADHTSGEVHFAAATIAREAGVLEAALPRYLGALRRNGYLTRVESKDGRRYWLQFDREALRPWSWDAEGDDDSTTERRTALVGGPAPSGFKPTQQVDERAAVAAAEAARIAQGVPIIEGSDAFKAWCNHCRAHGQITPYVRSITLSDGRVRRGFYMPTLFPPKATDADKSEGATA